MSTPKIILYTNHSCPWAHRAHIALKELGIPYEEVLIDLTVPREPWYLEINPRGQVPALNYDGNIITESAIVARFLADAHPPSLLPPSTGTENALYRARLDWFVDAFISKVVPHIFGGARAETEEARDKAAEDLVAAVAKDIEPRLVEGKGPFYGGSEKLTLAEVLTGSFLLRIDGFSKPEHNMISPKLHTYLESVPKFKRWMAATVQHNSVNYIWDEAKVVASTKRVIALHKK